ncbi:MAG: dockerin type I repeat-containing protein [Candidatus Zixiibacteriota bacterium]
MVQNVNRIILLICLILLIPITISAAESCIMPDNGLGTVDLPADCPMATAPGESFMIIDGLPPGSTLEMPGYFDNYMCNNHQECSIVMAPGICEAAGGSLGGEIQCYEATLYLTVSGTGSFTGFNRNLAVPVFIETHSAPRVRAKSEGTFTTDLYRLHGELFGDPDFCTFRILGGTDIGLPSPGEITLTDLGDGTFNVESFFDITYQIEFEGCPGSMLDGLSGVTTGTARVEQGTGRGWQPGDDYKMHFPQLPDEEGWNVYASGDFRLADDWQCSETGPVSDIHWWGSWKNGIAGDIVAFEVCIYSDIPDPDPTDPATHSMPDAVLWSRIFPIDDVSVIHITPDPQLMEGWYDPTTDTYLYNDHDNYYQYNLYDIVNPFIQEQGMIYWLGIRAVVPNTQTQWGWKSTLDHWNDDATFGGPTCTEPVIYGIGTVDLPVDCDYTSNPENPFLIIDGLPPGTTIEWDVTLTDFYCDQSTFCNGPLPAGSCEGQGGTLGGNYHCFEANLMMRGTGTGDLTGYNRTLNVPVVLEIHTGPRNPGDLEQDFPAELIRMQGQLFGDPDFCVFQISAGFDYGLPCPGAFEIDNCDPDWWVESFFDITYQIQFEGCPGSPLEGLAGITTATSRVTQGGKVWTELFEPGTADTVVNAFFITVDPSGTPVGGGGENPFGDGWYFYPQYDWWNIWFYDHPFSYDRYKTIHIEFDAFPMAAGPALLELAVNWSTDQWSLDQPILDSAPPLPGVNEDIYIGRQTLFLEEMFQGHYFVDYIIPDYNPEWVSIDVRGFNFNIDFGFIEHACASKANIESMDLSFVITTEPGECDCIPGDANNNTVLNILDITYLISYLYKSGPPPAPYALCSGDANCNCAINIIDITYLIAYLYKGGPAPCDCQQWLINCGPPLRK